MNNQRKEIKMLGLKFKCHFRTGMICPKNMMCENCEYQPEPNEKKNGKNEPVNIIWQEISEGVKEPVCPSCREYPYSLKRCLFCGQKFLTDDITKQWNKPSKEVRTDCIVCGGKNTMVGNRAKSNGHLHAICEKCGARMME